MIWSEVEHHFDFLHAFHGWDTFWKGHPGPVQDRPSPHPSQKCEVAIIFGAAAAGKEPSRMEEDSLLRTPFRLE